MMKDCEDFKMLVNFKVPERLAGAECLKTNSEWLRLRTCQTYGPTLCCDISSNKHMTAHYHKTKYPFVIPAEPNEKWLYFY